MKRKPVFLPTFLGPIYWFVALIRPQKLGGGKRIEGFAMGRSTTITIFIGALIWGSVLYVVLVLGSYHRLVDYLANEAIPPSLSDVANYAPASSLDFPLDNASGNKASAASVGDIAPTARARAPETVAAMQVLTELGDEGDITSVNRMACALKCDGESCAANGESQARLQGIPAALRLLMVATGKDAYCDLQTQCNDQAHCSENTRLAAARLLVGSLDCLDQDIKALKFPAQTCRIAPYHQATPWRPMAVATHMGCVKSQCEQISYFLQGAMNDPETRRRLVHFGMIYGWGRWLVLVLALGVASALCWRRLAQRNMYVQIASLMQSLKKTQALTRADRADHSWDAIGDSYPTTHVPNPGAYPVLALAYQARQSHKLTDATVVRDAVHQVEREMTRWWDLLTTLVTLFPVIGLAATLNGLIHAFAEADQIAVALGDTRAGAIRAMVAELSASFSTTFAALLVMAALTLWMVRLKHSEERAFEEVAEQVDTHLTWRGGCE